MDFAAEVGSDMASVIDRVVLDVIHTDRPVAEILALGQRMLESRNWAADDGPDRQRSEL